MRIYVAGHQGMVGSAVVRQIESGREHTWFGITKSELDLRNRAAVFSYLESNRPDAVIIAAAKVGGILANATFPVEFLTENLQIQTSLIDGSHAAGVKKLLFLGSSCIYPRLAQQPITEDSLLTGRLEPTNEPYAIAKIAGLKLVSSYRKQFGHDWISLMPTNLYGPGDNFHTTHSHVIPAIVSKILKAHQRQEPAVELFGTGSPLREFLHVDDLASAVLFALENYSGDVALNVGSGEEISILELAELVSKTVGYEGEIRWDTTMPDGTPRKLIDSAFLRSLGWRPTVTLEQGIRQTIDHAKSLQI